MSKAFEAFVTNVGPSAAFARSFENLTSLTRLKLHPPQKEYVLVHLWHLDPFSWTTMEDTNGSTIASEYQYVFKPTA